MNTVPRAAPCEYLPDDDTHAEDITTDIKVLPKQYLWCRIRCSPTDLTFYGSLLLSKKRCCLCQRCGFLRSVSLSLSLSPRRADLVTDPLDLLLHRQTEVTYLHLH